MTGFFIAFDLDQNLADLTRHLTSFYISHLILLNFCGILNINEV
uniref:Uncharacterized protein n=1 Tax=Myoviridae sp. ctakU3 TaxID=2825135 RepID=A0A8S5P1W4_9CAUD|nr:MAG TPA: hypothetical protein [Myoviridae sp. ctakU3]